MVKSSLVRLIAWQFLIAVPIVIHGAPDPKLVVNTTIGNVQGFLKQTFFKNIEYVSYKGIPYAEAPIGDLRFKAPKAKKATKTVHGSKDKYGASCFEYPFNAQSKKTRSEDCLFLNVFKPVNITKGTVIFFVHGGSYIQGDGTDSYYGPDFVMEKGDVILVTINYRLHAFGFLRIDDDDITGNMALKDAHLALRWTRDNIEKFGGDKNSIVVMGQSSGGITAHALLLNEDSAAIIKRVVVLSGSALAIPADMSAWSHQSLLFAEFANELGYRKDVKELKNFLKYAPVEKILQLGFAGEIDGIARMFWIIHVEKKTAENPKPFLTEHPRFIYDRKNIKTEVMFGVTSLEWGAMLDDHTYQEFIYKYNNEFIMDGVNFMDIDCSCNKPGFWEAVGNAFEVVRNFYFPEIYLLMDCYETRKTFMKLLSDQGRAIPVDLTVHLHSEKSKKPTFYCYFDVDLELNYCKNKSLKVPGAAHGEDMPYFMFATKLKRTYEKLKTSSDAKFVKTLAACRFMTDFIVEFAQTGFKNNKHGYKAVSAKPKEMHGILITNDGPKPVVNPNEAGLAWNEAYKLLKNFITYK